jgi:glycosyltransferase involved in cell wall biosynthesis
MSDFLIDEFYNNHHVKPAHLIPNGVDPSMFSKEPVKKDVDIIGAGSLSFLKQYDIFLEVIAVLKKNKPGIKAVLVGDGEHADGLKKMHEQLSLQQNVELKGMLTPAETINLMQRSKIFLHPSSYEGFSTACLEALYAGAHVISFIKPMHHEIKNWHIVRSEVEMQQKALELLNASALDHEPVLAYSTDDNAASMMKLLGFAE